MAWEDRLTLFVGYLIQNNRQSTTMHSYICAIKAVLRMNGIDIKEDRYLLASMVHACRLKNDKLRTRLPVQKGMLCILLETVQEHFLSINQPYLSIMYRALFTTMYYGMF